MSDMEEFGDAVELAQVMPREAAPPAQAEKHVCPYCGLAGPRADGPCARCTIEDSPQTRQATKARIGPWYVLQSRNPAAPGMKWSTLLSLVKRGQITPRSVVRGPTTHQLWRLGSQVKGLSREFGLCYSCGGQIDRVANQCPHCDRLQEPPANPDQLLEVRDLPRKQELTAESAPAGGLPSARAEAGRGELGLLTAKDLAAAFQLEFSGDDGGATLVAPTAPARKPPARQTADRPAAPAAVSQDPAIAVPPRRRAGRAFMVLTLLGIVGAAAVIWLNPEYQAKARDLVSAGVSTVSSQLKSSSTGPDAPPQVVDESHASAPDAANRPPTGDQQKPSVEPRQSVDRERATVPAVNSPSLKLPTDPDEIRRLVRSLRSQGIDAEAAGNDAKAIAQYEQIRKLPREYWPSDLDLRLEAARSRSK